MIFAQMSKSNSRTVQGLSRTIQRIFKENYINQKQHFYKHIKTGAVYIRQFNTFKY